MEERVVSGFPLPEEWGSSLDLPRWTAPQKGDRINPAIVEAVFGESPDKSWRFYAFDEVVGMTEEWRLEEDPVWFGTGAEAIDPLKSVLIGELGYDRPVALDYRLPVPGVRFMRIDGQWPLVASSLGELLEKLDAEA